MHRKLFVATAFFLLAVGVANASPILFLDQPNLVGNPGDIGGWDFSLTSVPTDIGGGTTITPWLVVSGLSFQPDEGMNPVGIFTPFITLPQNYAVVGPDTGNGEVNPFTQTFDNGAQTGLASYQINDFQSPGDFVSGQITLSYDMYSVSPNDPVFDPDTDYIGPGTVEVEVSISVGTSSVPEPSPALLVPFGVALLLVLRAKGVIR